MKDVIFGVCLLCLLPYAIIGADYIYKDAVKIIKNKQKLKERTENENRKK